MTSGNAERQQSQRRAVISNRQPWRYRSWFSTWDDSRKNSHRTEPPPRRSYRIAAVTIRGVSGSGTYSCVRYSGSRYNRTNAGASRSANGLLACPRSSHGHLEHDNLHIERFYILAHRTTSEADRRKTRAP